MLPKYHSSSSASTSLSLVVEDIPVDGDDLSYKLHTLAGL